MPRLIPLVESASTSWVYWVPGVVPLSVTAKVVPAWKTAGPETYQGPTPPNVAPLLTDRLPTLTAPLAMSEPSNTWMPPPSPKSMAPVVSVPFPCEINWPTPSINPANWSACAAGSTIVKLVVSFASPVPSR